MPVLRSSLHKQAEQLIVEKFGTITLNEWLLRCRSQGMSWDQMHKALEKMNIYLSASTIRNYYAMAAREREQAA